MSIASNETEEMGKAAAAAASSEVHEAARSGDLVKVVSLLASNPLSVNSRDKLSRTPYPFFSTSYKSVSLSIHFLGFQKMEFDFVDLIILLLFISVC